MSIPSGTRIGPYEFDALIGAGGMGEVYRARDVNLKRDVAIKLLPDSFLRDADRLARFQREAEILAALNHPNIAQIFGIEQTDGRAAIVMELVEGPTLAELIARGPIPADEAMGIAMQVASALEAAHARQIVHRDLKPANIKVRGDGTVAVLDFGISKPIDASAISGGSPVRTTPAVTETGVILGTAAYMSPEQARGKAVDQRTDIWAFGCLLFEMLTGQPAFGGEDVMLTLARVLDRETDLSSIPGTISPAVRHTIQLCLQKDAKNRIADIRDVKLALAGNFETGMPTGERASEQHRSFGRRAAPLAAALAAGVALTALLGVALWPEPEPSRVTRFTHVVEDGLAENSAFISDDGARIAYVAGRPTAVYVLDLDAFDAKRIAATEGESPSGVCFSPDASWIAYAANGNELRKAPIAGGTSQPIAAGLALVGPFCHWTGNGDIYFNAATGIMRVAANGGPVELIVAPNSANGFLQFGVPQLLPGGERLLVSVIGRNLELSVVVYTLATGEFTTLIERGGIANFAATAPGTTRGHIVFGQGNGLFAAAFDQKDLSIGPVTPVVENALGVGPFIQGRVSATGTLVYIPGDSPDDLPPGLGDTLLLITHEGSVVSRLDAMAMHGGVALSPTRSRVATATLDPASSSASIWIFPIDGGEPVRLASDGLSRSVVWTPDETRLLYITSNDPSALFGPVDMDLISELRIVAVDGGSAPITLVSDITGIVMPYALSPDGHTLVGTKISATTGSDIWTLSLDVGDGPGATMATPDDFKMVLDSRFDERLPALSPDGRWLAYVSNEDGRDNIFVTDFPSFAGKRLISTNGGTSPRWNPTDSELFYSTETGITAARFETEPAFRVLTRAPAMAEPLLITENPSVADTIRYDYLPERDQFVVLAPGATATSGPSRIRVVQNWFEELRQAVPWPER